MEDFFKFIPIVLWVLYKIVGGGKSKQEKRKKSPSNGEKKRRATSFEDILRELSGQPAEKEQPKPIIESETSEPTSYEAIDDTYGDSRDNERSSNNSLPIKKVVLEVDESTGVAPIIENEEIDLRKAIIYDAILNRPEY